MSKIPIAMHEHSNAVVIIAPREAMELFEQIAEGIDEPSEFNKRMAKKRGPGAPNRPGGCQGGCKGSGRPGGCKGAGRPGGCKGAGRPGGCKGAGRPGGCKGAPKQPIRLGRPTRGPEPASGAVNEGAIKNAIGNPIGQMFGKLLSARELRLDSKQKVAVHKLAQGCGQRLGHLQQRVIRAIKGMNPQQRAAKGRKMVAAARGEMVKRTAEARKRFFGILKPQQRPVAGKILGPHGPRGNKRPGCGGKCGGKCPKCRAGVKGESGNKGNQPPAAAPGGCGGCGGGRQDPEAPMKPVSGCQSRPS